MKKDISIEALIGKIFTSATGEEGGYEMVLSNETETVRFNHQQDCCESVTLKEITGNLSALVDSPIVSASVDTNSGEEDYDHFTWTYYRIATLKGSITVAWYGMSNGYYSESVDIEHETHA